MAATPVLADALGHRVELRVVDGVARFIVTRHGRLVRTMGDGREDPTDPAGLAALGVDLLTLEEVPAAR